MPCSRWKTPWIGPQVSAGKPKQIRLVAAGTVSETHLLCANSGSLTKRAAFRRSASQEWPGACSSSRVGSQGAE